MPNPFYKNITATGDTVWCTDWRISPFNASIAVVVPAGSTCTYEVDFTLDTINPTSSDQPAVTWITSAQFPAGSTTTILSNVNQPVTGIRLHVTAINTAGGPILFKILQPDSIN